MTWLWKDGDALSLKGIPLPEGAPNDGDVLIYDETSEMWAYRSISIVVPANERVINSVDDLPNVVDNCAYAEDNVKYKYGANLVTNINWCFDNVDTITEIDFGSTQQVYTGADPYLSGAPDGAIQFKNGIVINVGATALFNGVNGSGIEPFSAYVMTNVGITGFKGLGFIKGFSGINIDTAFDGNGQGLQIEDGDRVILNSSWGGNSVSSNSPQLSLSGTFREVIISSAIVSIITGESFLQLCNGSSFVSLEVNGNSFSDANGGVFLAPSLTRSITAFTDNGSGGTTVTSAAHGLTIEQTVTISGTTNYNGLAEISNVTDDTFDINKVFVGNDATGDFLTSDSNDFLDSNFAQFESNGSQIDSNEIAEINISSPFVVTISAPNTPVKANGANWVAQIERRCTFANAEITYIGLRALEMLIGATITIDSVSGNDQLSAYIAINGVIIPHSRATATAGFPTTFAPQAIERISTGDVISVYIENNTDSSNINVEFGNLRMNKI